MAEEVPHGPTIDEWLRVANKFNIYIVGGIAERERDCLYDSAALVGPRGHIGTYRKTHLWNEENLWFEPGNLGYPVFNLPFGRVGIRICYDIWFPETTRILAAQGADIICDATNWVVVDPLQTKEKPTAAYSGQRENIIESKIQSGGQRPVRFFRNSINRNSY